MVYLVGGIVRDVYLRRPVHDIDLTTPSDGRVVARKIANVLGGDYYPLDNERKVGRAFITWDEQHYTIDVAQFRGESLLLDLQDRDFTINALAVDLQSLEVIFDPTEGLQDIRAKKIRMCSPRAIANDPVRSIRAIRTSLSFGFSLHPDVKVSVREQASNLTTISKERVRDELFKLLDGPRPHAALLLLDTLGILPVLFPETIAMKGVSQSKPHIYDVWRHTLAVVDSMDSLLRALGNRRDDNTASNFSIGMVIYTFAHIRSDLVAHANQPWPNERTHRALLILAALAHDTGKPSTRTVDENGVIHFYQHEHTSTAIVTRWAEQLALSNDETERLQGIVKYHLRPAELVREKAISRRAVYRFWQATGTAGIDVCLHSIADQLGKYGATLKQKFWLEFMEGLRTLLDGYFEEHDALVDVKPLLNGDMLMAQFDLQPGPTLGAIIAAMREAQATQEINSIAEAQTWVTNWLKENQS